MKVSDAFPTKYLSAKDLGDDDWNITIASVGMEEVGQGEDKETKLVIHFEGQEKIMVCNKTNATVLGKLFGEETDAWAGKTCTLWVNPDVSFGGKIMPAIRVRAKLPK